MENKFKKLVSQAKKYWWVGLIIIIGLALFYLKRPAQINYDFVEVKTGTVQETVQVSGTVKAASQFDLAFEKIGRVSKIGAQVGQEVKAGDVLVALDNADVSAQLAQAQASVEVARAQAGQLQAALDNELAKLEEVKRGARSEELQISRTKVLNAQNDLTDAVTNSQNVSAKAKSDLANIYDSARDILSDVYAKSDDVINKQLDALFVNDSSSNVGLSFSSSDQTAAYQALEGRRLATDVLNKLRDHSLQTNQTDEVWQFSINSAKTKISDLKNFVDYSSAAVNGAIGLDETVVISYKYNINLARTSLNLAASSLTTWLQSVSNQKLINQTSQNTADSRLNNAKNILKLAQDELSLLQAGSSAEQIQSQEARVKQARLNLSSQAAMVKQAQASAENAAAQLSKGVIVAPVDGVVTKQDAKLGEIQEANKPIVSLIADSGLEVEAYLAELYISKVKLQNQAEVALDAFGTETKFQAVVSSIDLAATAINGVPSYKVKLQFITKDERLKSGLTANVRLITNFKDNVLVIPQAALVARGDKEVVLVKTNPGDFDNKLIDVPVEIGLVGSDGVSEVISGLSQGQMIAVESSKK